VLGHLHILLNDEWDSKVLLSIVLVGLPASASDASDDFQQPSHQEETGSSPEVDFAQDPGP
jgi:hypothetical protein